VIFELYRNSMATAWNMLTSKTHFFEKLKPEDGNLNIATRLTLLATL